MGDKLFYCGIIIFILIIASSIINYNIENKKKCIDAGGIPKRMAGYQGYLCFSPTAILEIK